MNRNAYLKKALKIFKKVVISAFLLLWSIGMFTGGLYGMAAVAFGVPAVIGFTVFEC